MKRIDMRFDKSILENMIGKKFYKYKCDPFEFTNSVTQIVGLYIGDNVYKITNAHEVVDYFGISEDIGVFGLLEVEASQVESAFVDVEMLDTPVQDVISSIKCVNELQKMSIGGVPSYEVWITRAIIFGVGGREVLFEKDSVPFSEEIIIYRGYNLLERISNNEEFLEGWDDEYCPECKRELIEINIE